MKAIIFDETFVPGLGRGPFLDPIEIPKDKFFLYKRMGLRIFDVTKTASIAETGVKNRHTRIENFNNTSNAEKKIINSVTNVNLEIKEEKPIIFNNDIKEIPDPINIKEEITEENIVETPNLEEVQDSNDNEEELIDNIDESSQEISEEDYLRNLTKKEIVYYCDKEGIKYENKTELLKLNKEELIKFVLNNKESL